MAYKAVLFAMACLVVAAHAQTAEKPSSDVLSDNGAANETEPATGGERDTVTTPVTDTQPPTNTKGKKDDGGSKKDVYIGLGAFVGAVIFFSVCSYCFAKKGPFGRPASQEEMRRRYLSRFPRGQVEVESGENVSQVSHARSTTGLVSQASRRDRGEAMQMAEVQTTTTRRNQVHSAIEEWAAAMSDMAARQQAAISNSDRKERSVTSVVPMQHFEQFMKEQEERSWQPLIHEYESIVKEEKLKESEVALAEFNCRRNRDRDTAKFFNDQTRVGVADELDGMTYINANWVSSGRRDDQIIATEAPLPLTTRKFWTMVWQYYSPVIGMITDLVEDEEQCCTKYWPELGETKQFADMRITCVATRRYDQHGIIIREIAIHRLIHMQTTTRFTSHIQFTGWRAAQCPTEPNSTVRFLQLLRILKRTNPGPIVLHCSNGLGRTGTLIAIDQAIRYMKEERRVDIGTAVRRVRSQRSLSIETPEQYIFIYKALLVAIQNLFIAEARLARQRAQALGLCDGYRVEMMETSL